MPDAFGTISPKHQKQHRKRCCESKGTMKSKIKLVGATLAIAAVSGCGAMQTETAQLSLCVSAPKVKVVSCE